MTSIWNYYPASQVVLEKNCMNDKWVVWLGFSPHPEERKMAQSLTLFRLFMKMGMLGDYKQGEGRNKMKQDTIHVHNQALI